MDPVTQLQLFGRQARSALQVMSLQHAPWPTAAAGCWTAPLQGRLYGNKASWPWLLQMRAIRRLTSTVLLGALLPTETPTGSRSPARRPPVQQLWSACLHMALHSWSLVGGALGRLLPLRTRPS